MSEAHTPTLNDVFARQIEKTLAGDLLEALKARAHRPPHGRTSHVLAAAANVRLDVALDALGGLERAGMVSSEIYRAVGVEHMTWSLVD